jgi:hypothetical protein
MPYLRLTVPPGRPSANEVPDVVRLAWLLTRDLRGSVVWRALLAALLWDGVPGCGASGGALGASGARGRGFCDMGRGADLAPDVGKPAAGSAGGERPGRVAWFFPGAPQVGGQRAGEQQLGVGGHDEAGPPVGLLGSADLGGGEPEGAFEEPVGVFFVESGPGRRATVRPAIAGRGRRATATWSCAACGRRAGARRCRAGRAAGRASCL